MWRLSLSLRVKVWHNGLRVRWQLQETNSMYILIITDERALFHSWQQSSAFTEEEEQHFHFLSFSEINPIYQAFFSHFPSRCILISSPVAVVHKVFLKNEWNCTNHKKGYFKTTKGTCKENYLSICNLRPREQGKCISYAATMPCASITRFI